MSSPIRKDLLFEEALNSLGSIIIVDDQNRIVYMNDVFAKSQGINAEESIGKKVSDVVQDSRLSFITETGKEEVGSFVKSKNGSIKLVNRIPIKRDDEVIGAIAVSTFANASFEDICRLNRKISELTKEAKYYKAELRSLRGAKYSIEQIISVDPKIDKLKELVRKVSQTKSTVLITGESGTGKELFAHAIHQLSPRNHFPFVRLNCAAIPDNLLESELFGFEEGAFTGARKGGSPGKFELANGGTLLLDEINSLPLSLQSKLLRVIQEKEIQKIGSSQSIEVDVRLVFITNQNLSNMVKEKTFREDLYYRINVVGLEMPPLRERMGDIPHLINYLIPKLNSELGLNITGIEPAVLELLQKHNWPGNVRELENSLERAINNAMTGELRVEHFDFLYLKHDLKTIQGENSSLLSLQAAREAAERRTIIQALQLAKGNKKLAAEILGTDRSVLYDKISKYKISM